MMTYLAMKHDTHVQRVDTVRAFSLGALYFVERLISRSHGVRHELKGMGAARPSSLLQSFDMGLELSLPRLEALAKFAFAMSLPQAMFCLDVGFRLQLWKPSHLLSYSLLIFYYLKRPEPGWS